MNRWALLGRDPRGGRVQGRVLEPEPALEQPLREYVLTAEDLAGELAEHEPQRERGSRKQSRPVQRRGQSPHHLDVAGSVIAWDWEDTDRDSDQVVLQGIVFATKRSCHTQGNWYEQSGDHHAEFRVQVGEGAVATSPTDLGWGRSNPIRARRGRAAVSDSAELPAGELDRELARPWFVPVSPNVMVTSVQPLEGSGTLVRYWEHEGTASTISLAGRPVGTEITVTDPFGDNPEPHPGDDLDVPAHGLVTIVLRDSTTRTNPPSLTSEDTKE